MLLGNCILQSRPPGGNEVTLTDYLHPLVLLVSYSDSVPWSYWTCLQQLPVLVAAPGASGSCVTPVHPAGCLCCGAAPGDQRWACYTSDKHSVPPATSPDTSCERHVGMATPPARL